MYGAWNRPVFELNIYLNVAESELSTFDMWTSRGVDLFHLAHMSRSCNLIILTQQNFCSMKLCLLINGGSMDKRWTRAWLLNLTPAGGQLNWLFCALHLPRFLNNSSLDCIQIIFQNILRCWISRHFSFDKFFHLSGRQSPWQNNLAAISVVKVITGTGKDWPIKRNASSQTEQACSRQRDCLSHPPICPILSSSISKHPVQHTRQAFLSQRVYWKLWQVLVSAA